MIAFLKGLLRNTLALLIAWMLFLVLGVVSLLVLAAGFSSNTGISVQGGSYLVVDLSRNIPDAPPVADFPLAIRKALQDSPSNVTYLYEMLKTVERAANDDRIAGIFLTGSFEPDGMGSSYASIRELRQAIRAFAESGKPVIGYMTNPDQRDLYLMSVADELYMNPFGIMDLTGLGAEIAFYDRAFDKFGVDVQVARVGKYKSAVEPYTRKSLSDENREQLEGYLEGTWQAILAGIGDGRGLDPATIQQLSDQRGILTGEEIFNAGLADHGMYLDQVIETMMGKGTPDKENNTFRQIDVLDYIRAGEQVIKRSKDPENQIAVVYAEGVILPGKSREGTIGAETLSRELRKLRKNEKVRAIVLRVNSPGGSAYAAEIIQRELDLIQVEMPLVVSQGAYAASGGYWLSAPADYIFAEPMTLTGSIGVFIMLPNFAGAADWLGLDFENVSTGDLANLTTPTRPKTEEEMAVFQDYANLIYDAFVGRVATGRNLETAEVDAVAQGRIWLGSEAVDQGLVDELGGLQDAIAYAVREAGVGADYQIVQYPTKKTFEEALAEKFSGDSTLLDSLRARLGSSEDLEWLVEPGRKELEKLRELRDPMGVYARMPFDLNL